jgi:hypothetical protein
MADLARGDRGPRVIFQMFQVGDFFCGLAIWLGMASAL